MATTIPSNRELEVLKVLWRDGKTTVRKIYEEMKVHRADVAYTTALTLMQTMEEKGFVRHERLGKTYVYYPKVERASVFRTMAGGFLDKVFDGALDEYVLHALQSRRLSAQELQRLEEMITDAKRTSKSRGKKRRRK